MAKSDLRVWAAKGAEQRLVEIAQEAKAIFASFPELRAPGRGFIAGGKAEPTRKQGRAQQKPSRRKKRTMSAEARKRIGDAQRARWAKHKGANGGGQTDTPASNQAVAKRARKKR